jgi:hypothetical protein
MWIHLAEYRAVFGRDLGVTTITPMTPMVPMNLDLGLPLHPYFQSDLPRGPCCASGQGRTTEVDMGQSRRFREGPGGSALRTCRRGVRLLIGCYKFRSLKNSHANVLP